MARRPLKRNEVVFLNPRTCGIYKNGGARYKTDSATGKRTEQVDNELQEYVDRFLEGEEFDGFVRTNVRLAFEKQVLVPRYYDVRYVSEFFALKKKLGFESIQIGELEDAEIIKVLPGHGSVSNDQRTGHIPYVKVSDIRSLRVNVNPTNLVTQKVAEQFWGGKISGLEAWDLITPNRASSNIGEFAVLLPGEEKIVITKEVFILRVDKANKQGWDPFYLLWALCLRSVRQQWKRIALMQTNREDVADRYREILLPQPKSRAWAQEVSKPFREFFTTLARAKTSFVKRIEESEIPFIASVVSSSSETIDEDAIMGDESTGN